MTKNAQTISVHTATIININAMIGAGIFSVPHALFCHAGPAGIITFLAVTIGIWCLASSFAELARRYPGAGSFYDYAERWGGAYAAFGAACSYLIGMILGMGLLTKIAGILMCELFSSPHSTLCALSILLLIMFLHITSTTLSTRGQQLLICATLLPLIIISITCLAHGSFQNLLPFAPYGFLPLFSATKIVIFGFFGFECATALTPLLANPTRDIPRAITRSIFCVSLLYGIFIFSVMLAFPAQGTEVIQSLPALLATIAPQIPLLPLITRLSILFALIGTIHAMIWSASSLLQSLSSHVSSYRFTRSQGITVLCINIAIACVTLHNIDLFFSLTALFVVTAYLCALITLLYEKSHTTSLFITLRTWLAIATAGLIAICALL